MVSTIDRFRGCLLGLAAGDAVGTTVEFRSRDSFEPLTDMVGGGPFELEVGQWTDDTSMALCLATSLVECGEFNPTDQMDRYVRWYRDGYLSSNGECFDIGNTVRLALADYQKTGNPYSGSQHPNTAGNGCIMRLAPVPMFYYPDRNLVQIRSVEARGDYQHKTIDAIRGSGYVVASLEAALWCFWRTESFEAAILMAANLGDDADTTAAICGQIAGAYYGMTGIPQAWRSKLTMEREIMVLADRLYEISCM